MGFTGKKGQRVSERSLTTDQLFSESVLRLVQGVSQMSGAFCCLRSQSF